jgi:hypothetical protein
MTPSVRRSLIACLPVVAMLASVPLAAPGPASAVEPTRVAPVNGKWGATTPGIQCDRTPAEGPITIASMPPSSCSGNPQPNDEVISFTLKNRRVTALALDLEIQCITSDPGADWVGNQLLFRPRNLSYVGLDGSTAVPASGLLRLSVDVEDTFDHVGGRILLTLDFRGTRVKAAAFYSGSHQEAGFFQVCASTQNHSAVFRPTLRRSS